MKSILLARASSKEQEDGQSIPAQTTRLREYNDKGHFPCGKVSWDVPRIGLEPTHLTAPEPKSGVSTNSTTWA
jgi:hypothetical protein